MSTIPISCSSPNLRKIGKYKAVPNKSSWPSCSNDLSAGQKLSNGYDLVQAIGVVHWMNIYPADKVQTNGPCPSTSCPTQKI